jgi:hypothetical protein
LLPAIDATAMRAHLPPENLRADEIAGQVDGENGVPFGKGQIIERAGTQYGRGVDQDVARPERFFDRRGCLGDTVDISRIAAGDDVVSAELAKLFARHPQTALIEVDGGDTRAGLGETDGRGAADAAAPARHHTDAA